MKYTALILAATMGCARVVPHTVDAAPEAPVASQAHPNEVQCLDLRDHSIDVFANEYLEDQGETLSPAEWTEFRSGWAEELVKSGAMDKFDRFCKRITIDEAACAMRASTSGGLLFCMRRQ